MTTTATILAQAVEARYVDDALDALDEILREHGVALNLITRTAGAYDLLAQVTGTDDRIATAAVAAQRSDLIARTLTLPHVTQETDPR